MPCDTVKDPKTPYYKANYLYQEGKKKNEYLYDDDYTGFTSQEQVLFEEALAGSGLKRPKFINGLPIPLEMPLLWVPALRKVQTSLFYVTGQKRGFPWDPVYQLAHHRPDAWVHIMRNLGLDPARPAVPSPAQKRLSESPTPPIYPPPRLPSPSAPPSPVYGPAPQVARNEPDIPLGPLLGPDHDPAFRVEDQGIPFQDYGNNFVNPGISLNNRALPSDALFGLDFALPHNFTYNAPVNNVTFTEPVPGLAPDDAPLAPDGVPFNIQPRSIHYNSNGNNIMNSPTALAPASELPLLVQDAAQFNTQSVFMNNNIMNLLLDPVPDLAPWVQNAAPYNTQPVFTNNEIFNLPAAPTMAPDSPLDPLIFAHDAASNDMNPVFTSNEIPDLSATPTPAHIPTPDYAPYYGPDYALNYAPNYATAPDHAPISDHAPAPDQAPAPDHAPPASASIPDNAADYSTALDQAPASDYAPALNHAPTLYPNYAPANPIPISTPTFDPTPDNAAVQNPDELPFDLSAIAQFNSSFDFEANNDFSFADPLGQDGSTQEVDATESFEELFDFDGSADALGGDEVVEGPEGPPRKKQRSE